MIHTSEIEEKRSVIPHSYMHFGGSTDIEAWWLILENNDIYDAK